MKKITLLLLLCVFFCGCQTQEKSSQKTNTYSDGTYTTSANGYGGEFQVETILKDDKIQDILVKEHNETPSIGGVAIEQMIKNMKSENKADVDLIAGATKTSQALKDAVVNAFDQAKNK